MIDFQDITTDTPEIKYVLNAASSYAAGDGGGLISFYDARNGQPVDTSPMIEDFGDIAPFLWMTGATSLAQTEFSALTSALDRDPFHVNPRSARPWMVNTYDWTDLLLGLIDYYRLSGESHALDTAGKMVDLWDKFFFYNGSAYGKAIKFGQHLCPLPISKLLDVGMFPELLTRYAACLEPRKADLFRRKARSMISVWIHTSFNRETGLFPDTLTSTDPLKSALETLVGTLTMKSGGSRKCTLFKNNTNALASVLAVWEDNNDPLLLKTIDRWVEGCRTRLLAPSGMINMQWAPDTGVIQGPTDHNFQVIDLLCDISHATKNDAYLDLARTVATAWIGARGKSGLIPHEFSGKKAGQAMSDSQTDFAVALFKLSALTGETSYSSVAEEIMGAVKRYMYLPCGMATWVDVESGDPVSTVCKTKFMILSLKGWLALHNKDKIYRNEAFTELLNDR